MDTNDQETQQETGTTANRRGNNMESDDRKPELTGTMRIEIRQSHQIAEIQMVTRE